MNADWLPDWAIAKANGKLVVGASLPTKDGRRTGNAVVATTIDADEAYATCPKLYVVVTDMGNMMTLTEDEVSELFYEPTYVRHERDIRKRMETWPHD